MRTGAEQHVISAITIGLGVVLLVVAGIAVLGVGSLALAVYLSRPLPDEGTGSGGAPS